MLGWLAIQAFSGRPIIRELGNEGAQYEMVPDSSLPDEPAAVIVTDVQGKTRWTVSIPHRYDFPLKPDHYREICKQVDEMSMHIADLGMGSKFHRRHLEYYGEDPNFLDVADAESQSILSIARAGSGKKESGKGGMGVCKRSMTYVLETSDAGIGSSLMGLWMAYGLAKKEGRAFFVDDTRWPYGKYNTLFKPAPVVDCAPPPTSHRLPCPRSAAHLVVSAATIQHTFGNQFHEEFEDPKKIGVMRQEPIFALARTGYEDLFHLADDGDTKYALDKNTTLMSRTRSEGGVVLGLHVRRGDKHPWEFQYSKDYLPLMRYMDEAKQILAETYESDDVAERADGAGHSHAYAPGSRALDAIANTRLAQALPIGKASSAERRPKAHDSAGAIASKMLLASDDPDVYDNPEVSGTTRAQDRIVLASKTALEKANADQPKNQYIDEIHGWEGGFFKDVFWGLGQDTNAASAAIPEEPSDAALALRAMVGRAYLLDLAVLAESDYVVCGVSAMGCRLLAVMMGWEKAIVQKGWRNIDSVSSFEWTGIVW